MAISMRESYGRALAEYGAQNERVVALDVDTSTSTQSQFFANRWPERFFNIGIAEPCMVDVAVGLALGGYIPFANGFAALLALRALEQVRTCVAYARANVKLVAGYAGVSDFKDGPTHHSISDLAILRSLPGMTVIAPADALEAAAWVPVIAEYDGPVYLRISRAETPVVHHQPPALQIGRGLTLRNGGDLTIIACGAMTGRTLQAAQLLEGQGISARVIELPTLKPLDEALILQAAEETGAIVTAEEHTIRGGLGGAVAEYLAGCFPVPVAQAGIADTFARTAKSPEAVMDAFGMGLDDILHSAHSVLKRKPK